MHCFIYILFLADLPLGFIFGDFDGGNCDFKFFLKKFNFFIFSTILVKKLNFENKVQELIIEISNFEITEKIVKCKR